MNLLKISNIIFILTTYIGHYRASNSLNEYAALSSFIKKPFIHVDFATLNVIIFE